MPSPIDLLHAPLIDSTTFNTVDEINTPQVDHESSEASTPVLPSTPNLAQDVEHASVRLNQLMEKVALQMPSMNGSLTTQLQKEIPRPKLFHAGYQIHTKVMDAAKKCDEAARALSQIPTRAFATQPISQEAFSVLKNYTESQNALYSKLNDFMKATKQSSPLLTSALQATQNRAAEALNLVATLQIASQANLTQPETLHARQHLDAFNNIMTVSMSEGMAKMSSDMHGAKVKHDALTAVSGLADRLDKLESQRTNLSLDDFKAQAQNLKADINQLRQALPQDLTADSSELTLNKSVHLIEDISLNESFKALLDRADTRLNVMTEIDPKNEILSSFNDLYAPIPMDEANAFVSSLPREIKAMGQTFLSQVERYNETITNIQLKLQAGNLVADDLRTQCQSALSSVKNQVGAVPRMMLNLAHGVHEHFLNNPTDLINFIRKHTGVQLTKDQAKACYKWLNSAGQSNQSVLKLNERFTSGILTAAPALANAETQELAGMLRASQHEQLPLTSDYVSSALEHDLSFSTLINASLRHIPVDQLELRANQQSLVSQQHLGQGAINAVTLCEYADKDGTPMKLVFKPEVSARHGLAKLSAVGCGYHEGTRIMQLNVATTLTADQIGVGDVVARSKIGTLDGRIGLFMEAAPGKEAVKWKENFEAFAHTLKKNNVFETARGQLMRSLSNLEWADALSGQVDRHNSNYLVDINPQTGSVKVTGIDNDLSFGTKKVGITTFLTDGIEPDLAQQMGITQGQTQIDGSNLPKEGIMALRNAFGINQISKPTHIDRETFEKLISINPHDYRQSLSQCLEPNAVDAAVLRLIDAQNHARTLEIQGAIVEGNDWKSDELFKSVLENRVQAKGKSNEARFEALAKNGFFARDFATLFAK